MLYSSGKPFNVTFISL